MFSSKCYPASQILLLVGLTQICIGCASLNSFLGATPPQDGNRPIANPFASYKKSAENSGDRSIILRTKKGDRSVEVEIPGDAERMSEFVIPVSPAFRDTNARSPASSSTGIGVDGLDESYKQHNPSFSDREITGKFPQGLPEDEGKRRSIEQGLFLAPSDEDSVDDKSLSYLAGLDRIKQLYKITRYEAALLETDEMIKLYQTDSKLHEMRGTLLERMGRRALALKSWNQAFRFDPKNEGLRRFLERKTTSRVEGGA